MPPHGPVMMTPEEIDAATGEPDPAGEPPGASDTAPRTVRSRPKDRVPKASVKRTGGRPTNVDRRASRTKELGAAAGMILAMPGMVFGMVGEPYLAEHFAGRPVIDPKTGEPKLDTDGMPEMIPGAGHRFGMQLAIASESNAQLRTLLERLVIGDSIAVLVMGLIAYAAPPIVYLATPNTSPLRRTFNVPQRLNTQIRRDHAADARSSEGEVAPQADQASG